MNAEARKNEWRLEVNGGAPWADRLAHNHPQKYLIVSCDSHVNEPFDHLEGWIDPAYRSRLPYIRKDENGTQWLITDGWEPQLISIPPERSDLLPERASFEDYEVLSPFTAKMDKEDTMRTASGRSVEQRSAHMQEEGIDAEIIFPQKGLFAFATPDIDFGAAMARAWNRWAHQYFHEHFDRMLPMALIVPGNVDSAIKEVQWAAANGFRGIQMPSRPIFTRATEPRNLIHYNHRMFDPLWAAIEETGLPVTYHIATGEDPRAAKGGGGALTSLTLTTFVALEPVVTMIAAGVFERFRKLKIATVETNVGWIPAVLNIMDNGRRSQHMWQRPELPRLPSEYFAQNCYTVLLEDTAMLETVVRMGFEDNILWSNDYPHHEGSFPHSHANIQRQMRNLSENQRAKILGLNAIKLFNINVGDKKQR